MGYYMRDRPDGQVEIVLSNPILIGTFPDRAIARRVCELLQTDAIDWPEETRSSSATPAAADISPEVSADHVAPRINITVTDAADPVAQRMPAMVAAAVDAGVAQTQPDWEAMFARLEAGEPLTAVAVEYGVPMTSLRARWVARPRPGEGSAGGQVNCSLCSRPFRPSLASPDKCARCSRD